jgi:hypothetical protein
MTKQQTMQQPKSRVFFLRTQQCVEQVALFSTKNLYLGMLQRVRIEGEHVFNGVTTEDNLTAVLLGSEGKTHYEFNNLFSVPFNDRTKAAWLKSGQTECKNTIIVNTAPGFGGVCVKFPKNIQDFWKLPKTLYLYKIPLDKIKFDDSVELSNDAYMERGINPNGDNFIASVNMAVPEPAVLKMLDPDTINKEPITVKCYGSSCKLSLKIDDSGEVTII